MYGISVFGRVFCFLSCFVLFILYLGLFCLYCILVCFVCIVSWVVLFVLYLGLFFCMKFRCFGLQGGFFIVTCFNQFYPYFH